jgi:NTE family protein
MERHKRNQLIRRLLDRVPQSELTDQEIAMKADLDNQPEINLMHLIYRQAAYETQAKDYDFSAASMREHWQSGYRDTLATLEHKEWMSMPSEEGGIVVHDVHNIDD